MRNRLPPARRMLSEAQFRALTDGKPVRLRDDLEIVLDPEIGGGGRLQRIIAPRPGHWLIRLTKGGAEVPARIASARCEPGTDNLLSTGPILVAEIAGAPADPLDVWLKPGRAILPAEYAFRMAEAAWLREHAPADPKARPREKADIAAMEPPF